jgi:hypothetical protein
LGLTFNRGAGNTGPGFANTILRAEVSIVASSVIVGVGVAAEPCRGIAFPDQVAVVAWLTFQWFRTFTGSRRATVDLGTRVAVIAGRAVFREDLDADPGFRIAFTRKVTGGRGFTGDRFGGDTDTLGAGACKTAQVTIITDGFVG